MSTTHVTRRNTRIHPKQIDTHFIAPFIITGFNVAAPAATSVVTSAITTALNTAGRNNTSVPLQVASGIDVEGVALSTSIGIIRAFNEDSAEPPQDGSANEIYGRLTESGGAYTVTWYVSDGSGGDSAANIPAGDYRMVFGYNFSIEQLPNDAFFAGRKFNVGDDPTVAGATGLTAVVEVINVTALNTLAALSQTPAATVPVTLNVNGVTHTELDSGITQTGTALTWNATTMTYDLETTDRVIAHYYV